MCGARLSLRASFLGAVLVSGCLIRAKPDQPPLVGDVDFKGNLHISSKELRSRIALTRSGRHFLIDFGGRYTFEHGGLKTDTRRILRVYQAHGYYEARVTDIETHADHGRINVTFTIDEGLPVHITSIDITGMDAVWPETRRYAESLLPVHVGDVFAEDPYEQSKTLLETRLKNNGYLKTKVTGHVDVDTAQRTARIALTVVPGLPFYVGEVMVEGILGPKGHDDVSHERVIKASKLKPGELLTPKVVNQARDGVSAMGVFATVDVEQDLSQQRAPIRIVLTEAPFQSVETGGGLSIDQIRQAAQGTAIYTNKNLARDLQKIIAGGSLGYAFLPSVFNREAQGIISNLQLQYLQPRVFYVPIDAGVKLDYTKDIIPAVHYQRIGLRPGLTFYMDRIKGLSFAPSINYEYYFQVGAGPGGGPGSVLSPLRTTGCGSPSTTGAIYTTCIIGYLEGQLNYDLRDNPLEPRKGAFLALNVQWAGLPLSDFRYIRYSPEARVYIPVPWSRNFVIALRGRFGYLQDLQGTNPNDRSPPIMAHFFAGGANSVRAAGTELMGPETFALETNTGSNEKQIPYAAAVPIPIGGDHVAEGSIELRWFTPVDNLGVVLFFDAGRVWTTNPRDVGYQLPEAPAQYGPGFGIRYRTPLGPLRFDLAYRTSAYTMVPVNVDTSQIINPPKGAAPPSVLPQDYRISTDCPSHTATPWTCYSVARINFYLTVGEAF